MRTLTYKILKDKNHIEPRTRQWAGMQFEDNATEVVFDLSELNLDNALYRIDFNSAGAGYQPSENLDIKDGKISRYIPSFITQYGGEVQVTAVITMLDENGDATGVCLSYPVLVYFTEVERDAEGSKVAEKNISAAEASALDAASRAEQAAQSATESENAAEDAKEKTEAARRALEEGSEFVFSGGNAQGSATVKFVVDDELSATSENAIANKAVFEAINRLDEDFLSNKEDTDTSIANLMHLKESASNKVKTVNQNSTDNQYPTAKCLYDNLINVGINIDGLAERLVNLENQKVLWNGENEGTAKGYVMNDNQTIKLSESISSQSSGIVLVFQPEEDGIAAPNNFNTHFIPKQSVADNNGQGRGFPCFTTRCTNVGLKYIYISDNELKGADGNVDAGTGASGIIYNNKKFYLTKVYGV